MRKINEIQGEKKKSFSEIWTVCKEYPRESRESLVRWSVTRAILNIQWYSSTLAITN